MMTDQQSQICLEHNRIPKSSHHWRYSVSLCLCEWIYTFFLVNVHSTMMYEARDCWFVRTPHAHAHCIQHAT